MSKRPYRSGMDGYTKVKAAGIERISKFRVAMLNTFLGNTSLYSYPWLGDDETVAERGRNVFLYLPGGRGRQVRWNLSSLTEEELKATKAMFDLAFELAEPVVKHRDKVAQDALAEGDDSYTRVYRAVPVYVVREGPLAAHNESVRLGFIPVPGDNDDEEWGSSDGGELRTAGDGVATGDEVPDLSSYNQPPPDLPESLGEVRGVDG